MNKYIIFIFYYLFLPTNWASFISFPTFTYAAIVVHPFAKKKVPPVHLVCNRPGAPKIVYSYPARGGSISLFRRARAAAASLFCIWTAGKWKKYFFWKYCLFGGVIACLLNYGSAHHLLCFLFAFFCTLCSPSPHCVLHCVAGTSSSQSPRPWQLWLRADASASRRRGRRRNRDRRWGPSTQPWLG